MVMRSLNHTPHKEASLYHLAVQDKYWVAQNFAWVFYNILWKSPHKLFGQPGNTLLWKLAQSRGSNLTADFHSNCSPSPYEVNCELPPCIWHMACLFPHILHFSQLCPIPLLLSDLVRYYEESDAYIQWGQGRQHTRVIFSSSLPIVKHHESIKAFSFPAKPRFGSRVLPTKVLR